ncbi:MAG: hypothetical protein K2Y26_20655 [Gemmatimonadaceae bacterium]|nr:hypothetical protein [Gemmatimonadaceae bacterium]
MTLPEIPRPSRRLRWMPAALLFALFSGVGCYKNTGSGNSGSVVMIVNNRGFFDVNVFSVRATGASNRRLGLVNGNSQRTIMVPESELQPGGMLQVAVRAVAGRVGWISPALQVGPGIVARLEIITTAGGDVSQSQFFTQFASPSPSDTLAPR